MTGKKRSLKDPEVIVVDDDDDEEAKGAKPTKKKVKKIEKNVVKPLNA